jgi:hypothetical protein
MIVKDPQRIRCGSFAKGKSFVIMARPGTRGVRLAA